jgi:hypothetical protein
MPGENRSDETTAARPPDIITGAASTVIQKAEEFGRRAAERVNETRSSAASGLESAASTIRERAEQLPGGEKVTEIARSTADKLSATANYMRTHEVTDVVAGVKRIIRRNPGQAFLAAAVVGFLAGRALRERD